MEIQGKIIRIVDNTTVIINLGRNNGIKSSSIFSIIGSPEPIVDPFTKEELGSVSIVKAKVKAAQVHDRFTIAVTKWTATSVKLSTTTLASQFNNLFETETVDQGDLLVSSLDLQPWKAKSETPVKVGDIVTVEIAGSAKGEPRSAADAGQDAQEETTSGKEEST